MLLGDSCAFSSCSSLTTPFDMSYWYSHPDLYYRSFKEDLSFIRSCMFMAPYNFELADHHKSEGSQLTN